VSHGLELTDAYRFGGDPPRFLGYVIDLAGVRVYHAGDTIPYDGIEDVVCDVAMLPINGRDAEREAHGIVGNLDAEEAVRLAAAIGANVLVPIHYDMFAANPGDPARVVAAALREPRAPAVLVPTRRRPFVFSS
jgi:L-ascorbate metabolism protein UlaG (beta-lactamase superfamily)